jgi:class I fructose-bisphosphate aldolase
MFAKQLLKTKFICPIQISDTFLQSNRNGQTIRSLTQIYNHGRLSGTGYLSILPVDQGIEHTVGSSFAPNTMYFDPENIVKLAIEAGCNAIASRWWLSTTFRKYAHKIPLL